MNLTVSPIPYGLRRDEILYEVVNSLQQLESIIEVVFQSIDHKVGSFGPTLSDINVRTTNCALKLNQLKTWSTRATKVFSSHKYPKTELSDINRKVFKSVSNEIGTNFETKHSYESTNCDLNNNNSKRFGQLIPFDDQSIDDKIKFFKVNFSVKTKSEKRNPLFDRIGSIRWHRIHSLSSLLIFNTSEVAFVSRSPKSINLQQNQSKDVVDFRKRLDSAPKSMTTPVEDINELHFLHSGSAPQIMEALPIALPFLPGIADEFVSDSHDVYDTQSIAGNQSLIPNLLPVLPNFDSLGTNPSVQVNIVNSANVANNAPINITPNVSKLSVPSPPPPPPPPPPPIFDGTDTQIKVSPIVLPPPPPLPPTQVSHLPVGQSFIPPPPPISALPPPPPPPSAVKDKPMPANTIAVDNGRASLLESIRNAGGKPKAKTIKEKKIDKKLQQKENKELGTTKSSSGGGGGDLMSDLMSRLALRRDGISGNQKAVNKSGGPPKPETNVSAMDRISAMIPPPMISSDNEVSDPEDDWTD